MNPTPEQQPAQDDDYQSRFVGTPDEMIVDGKVFIDGKWVAVEELRKRYAEENPEK